jgi:hypothetical protein
MDRSATIFIGIFISLLGITIPSASQTDSCAVVHRSVDDQPVYGSGMQALMEYFQKALMPVVSRDENKEQTTKMMIVLTIDANGRVTDVVLSRHMLCKKSEEELREKILSMPRWSPGRLNGKNVCCRYDWIIGCIKWE